MARQHDADPLRGHDGSTMTYTLNGSVFLQQGDKVSFRDDFTPI